MKTVFLAIPVLALLPAGGLAPAGIPYTTTTVAGLGDCGDGGAAALARIGAPEGLAVDSSGNIYISDALDHRVRKVSPAGIVTTVAGSGRPGFRGDGGPAAAARLNAPYGLAVDAGGNVYIADLGNARIRKVSADGIMSTLAGGGDTDAGRLSQPRNVALDAAGNLYFSDFGGHSVYRLTTDGALSRIAGNGRAGSVKDGVAGDAALAPLRSPAGLAIDRSGVLYIADSGNHRIRKVKNGLLTTVPQGGALLDTPTGIALDAAGDLYVADKGMSAVWKLTPAPLRFAGTGTAGDSGDGGPAVAARLNQPREIVFDSAGNLYIADTTPSVGVVRRVAPSGTVHTFAGGQPFRPTGDDGPAISAYLDAPTGLALDSAGSLYIADRSGHRVRMMSSGIISTAAGIGYAGSGGDGGFAIRAQLEGPESVALDAAGNVWLTEPAANRLRKVDSGGYISTVQAGTMNFPTGIAVDSDGNAYVADTFNHVVRRITPDGRDTVFAGTGVPGYAGDGGPAAAALLQNPAGLCFDSRQNLYIADSGNHVIRKVTPEGGITTVAGRGEASFGGDGGPAVDALLNTPGAMAADAGGNLYIADTGNERIRKVDARGVIETIAELDEPAGVAVDAAGTVYVADRGNGLIRKLTPTALPPPVIAEPPEPAVTSLVNSASMLAGAVAPGEIATLYGAALDSAQVLVDGEPAALLYGGAGQINFVVPRAVAGRATAEVEVRTPAASLRLIVPVAESNPGIFTLAAGTGQAAAANEDGTPNSADNPAARGSVLTFYATGEGTGVPLGVEIGGERAAIMFTGTHGRVAAHRGACARMVSARRASDRTQFRRRA